MSQEFKVHHQEDEQTQDTRNLPQEAKNVITLLGKIEEFTTNLREEIKDQLGASTHLKPNSQAKVSGIDENQR